LSTSFKENIINNFVNEYLAGRTPNPCVLCNPIIKWAALLKKADSLNAKYISTGHYVNLRYDNSLNRHILSKGIDATKDQSYFLWKLDQEQLSRTLFPLGNYSKVETRQLAQKFKLSVEKKPDSQEICFVKNDDYKEFLRNSTEFADKNIGNGDIIFDGKIVGTHIGYPFYTIGQRKGLGISYPLPLYVKNIYPDRNIIEVATVENLTNRTLIADSINFIKYEKIEINKELNVKIRYRDKGSKAFCKIIGYGIMEITFDVPKKSITKGQSVVIYEGEDLVAGGIIKDVF
jgi:tRNA-uridine 2-sulfurtransferase